MLRYDHRRIVLLANIPARQAKLRLMPFVSLIMARVEDINQFEAFLTFSVTVIILSIPSDFGLKNAASRLCYSYK